MLTARRGPAGAVVGKRFHVFGGQTSGTYLPAVEAYEPVAHFWVPWAEPATARARLGIGVIGGLAYAVAGRNSTSAVTATHRYTP